jgi:hypothetical protein
MSHQPKHRKTLASRLTGASKIYGICTYKCLHCALSCVGFTYSYVKVLALRIILSGIHVFLISQLLRLDITNNDISIEINKWYQKTSTNKYRIASKINERVNKTETFISENEYNSLFKIYRRSNNTTFFIKCTAMNH